MLVATSPPPAATTRARSAPTGRRPTLQDGHGPQALSLPGGRTRRELPVARTRNSGGPVVVVDLAEGPAVRPAVTLASGADAEPAGAGSAPGQARLPLGRLAGLAGSAAFAFWTSLTCFVC